MRLVASLLLVSAGLAEQLGVAELPRLPSSSATVEIPAQNWPFKPGPRTIAVHLRYPGASSNLSQVKPSTGLMLSLHNWGGSGFVGTADPAFLATNYDVVAIGVDYLQSGRKASIEDPEPYDFGWLQALDALRALFYVFDGLDRQKITFARDRIFTTGGSGGGNVSLMANKLAPHTFAVVVDLCGMKKLSDDVAFHLPGGSELNARYDRDPGHPFYLSPDAQEIRILGHPGHLRRMKQLGCSAKIITVHGVEDIVCLDVAEYVANMQASGLNFTYVPVTPALLDGQVFTSAGHALGDRTKIVDRVAGRYLRPDSVEACRLRGATDFERREKVSYQTSHGVWTVDYAQGLPVGTFVPSQNPSK